MWGTKKNTRLIIPAKSHSTVKWPTNIAQELVHCWFEFDQFRQPLWKTLALLLSYFPRAFTFSERGCSVASRSATYICVHSCTQATPHALKKRGLPPPQLYLDFTLAVTLPSLFPFLPSGSTRPPNTLGVCV